MQVHIIFRQFQDADVAQMVKVFSDLGLARYTVDMWNSNEQAMAKRPGALPATRYFVQTETVDTRSLNVEPKPQYKD